MISEKRKNKIYFFQEEQLAKLLTLLLNVRSQISPHYVMQFRGNPIVLWKFKLMLVLGYRENKTVRADLSARVR
jgi:hypothetical protein